MASAAAAKVELDMMGVRWCFVLYVAEQVRITVCLLKVGVNGSFY